MDAAVRLALMAKAKNVFESDDTVLSFPALNPLTKSKDWFQLALSHGMTDAELTAASEFARIVNAIPDGVLFDGTSEEFLWEVYEDVLARATAAGGSLTPDEQAARLNAAALLYTTAADGTRSESARWQVYKQCRDAVIAAQEEFRNAEGTAEAAGPDSHAAWLDGPGAASRARLEALQQDWATRGSKDLIEAALRVEETLSQKGAGAQWTEWHDAFDPKIDLPSDLQKQPYGPTGLVPCDAIALDEWPTFTLSGEEITTLVNSAPPELKNLLGSSTTASDVVSLSFEYRSAALNRPWFNPKVFRARCWKFGDDEPLLSDGATPPTGRCPAYVVALVLARNINVVMRQPSGGVQHVGWRAFPAIQREELHVVPQQHVLVMRSSVVAAARVAESSDTPARSVIRRGPATMMAGHFATPSIASTDIRRAALARLAASEFRVAPVVLEPPPAPPTAAPPPPVPTDMGTRDQVSVLAMICRRLPKSPDPDPSLDWS